MAGWLVLATSAACAAPSAAVSPGPPAITNRNAGGSPSQAASARIGGGTEMPTVVPASLREPGATPDESGREITGRGRLTVRLESEATDPALVKIRAANGSATLVQVQVAPGQPRDIQLDGGAYQMLIMMKLGQTTRYFKGAAFTLPTGVDGTVILRFRPVVGAGSAGQSLQEISATEFER